MSLTFSSRLSTLGTPCTIQVLSWSLPWIKQKTKESHFMRVYTNLFCAC